MSGYQESVTDPSFARQIITFTYPHIGNYGVSQEAMESDRIHARAVVMRAAMNTEDAPGAERGWLDWLADCGVPAISEVDTRALVRHIRDAGSMRGGVFPALDAADARRWSACRPSRRWPAWTSRAEVTPSEMTVHGSGDGPRIAAIDTGIKLSIVRHLVARGAVVELHPCSVTAEELLARDADLVFLANGPGDPAVLDHIVQAVRGVVGKRPVWGICLGHQLLCQAVGLETYKLPFGHRGANHPVKDLTTQKIEITSQNHGFAVRPPGGAARMDTVRARALGDGLRRRRADARQPLRRHRRGAHAARRPRLDGPVPPRGGPRPERLPLPLRPLPERREGGRLEPCHAATTSSASSSSARARSSSARPPSSTTPACRPARSCARRATRSCS